MVSWSLAHHCYSTLVLMTLWWPLSLWSQWHFLTFWDWAADRKQLACSDTSWVWPAAVVQMVWAERVVSSHSPLTGIRLGWTPPCPQRTETPFNNRLPLHLSFCCDIWSQSLNLDLIRSCCSWENFACVANVVPNHTETFHEYGH